jgi:hypothetical protein
MISGRDREIPMKMGTRHNAENISNKKLGNF